MWEQEVDARAEGCSWGSDLKTMTADWTGRADQGNCCLQYYLLSNQLDDDRALVIREKGMMTEQEGEHYRGRGGV